MSIFSKILQKIGLSKPDTPAAPAAVPAKPAAPAATPAAKPVTAAAKSAVPPVHSTSSERPAVPAVPAAATPAKPAAIAEVDVLKNIEQMAAGSGLNWKVSIVDLLKVLGIDSSLDARKELATELNCPADLMKDSAKMNVWLHKEVLRQIAQNGGNIPKELLD